MTSLMVIYDSLVLLQVGQKLNVRCIPKDVLSLIKALSEDQRRVFLVEKGFSSLLDITLDALGRPNLIGWLYDHINPDDRTLNVGPGKIKITKEVVRLVLGLPSTGGSLPRSNWQEKVKAAVSLRQQLGVNDPKDLDVQLCINRVKRGGLDALTMRCFYLAMFKGCYSRQLVGKSPTGKSSSQMTWRSSIKLIGATLSTLTFAMPLRSSTSRTATK